MLISIRCGEISPTTQIFNCISRAAAQLCIFWPAIEADAILLLKQLAASKSHCNGGAFTMVVLVSYMEQLVRQSIDRKQFLFNSAKTVNQ